jgi:hypothetical protein
MLYIRDNAIPLRHHHVVREPQRPVSGGPEPRIPFPIALRHVERAIQFDDQPGAMTREVGDEPADRDLAAEMQAATFAKRPEPTPQTPFPAGRVLAKLTC